MDGVHDVGGMENIGAIPVEENEPVFHHNWEARVMGMRMAMGFWRKWTLDGGRHSVECLPPADYFGMSYYEKWLASLVNLMVGAGLVSRSEIETGKPDAGAEKQTPPIDGQKIMGFVAAGKSTQRDIEDAPKFSIGDKVHTAAHMHAGHTRLPRYARDKVGTVVLHHGAHVFPDTYAHLQGEHPRHLYTVEFSGNELWGEDGDPSLTVTADLWESYLVPA